VTRNLDRGRGWRCKTHGVENLSEGSFN